MKATIVFLVSLNVSLMTLPASASAATSESAPAIRVLDRSAAEAFALGVHASPAFRALVDALEGQSVVVHVVGGRPPVFGAMGSTRLVNRVGRWLYLRVVLDPRVPLEERAALLGHELHHVREIAEALAATQDDMRRLYERIGRKAGGALFAYETPDAIDAGVRVLREVRAFATTHALRAADGETPQE